MLTRSWWSKLGGDSHFSIFYFISESFLRLSTHTIVYRAYIKEFSAICSSASVDLELSILGEACKLELVNASDWVLPQVLFLNSIMHAHLSVGHSNCISSSLCSFNFTFSAVAVLNLFRGALTVVVCEDGVDRSLRSISLAVAELFCWQNKRLLLNKTKWNSSIMGSTELVLIASIN